MLDIATQGRVESSLRENWEQLWPRLLERFTTISKADLDSAVGVQDLVRRISDKTHYSDRYVETEVQDLVLAGVGSGTGLITPQEGRPFIKEPFPGHQH